MAIDSILSSASAHIASAIRDAARSTGASFEYLLTAARIESNLNPKAQAPTSSATGLYQFIDQTWLSTLKQAGAAHGYGQYADAISVTADGRYDVADPGMRAAIMRLRNDPAASALMAGAFTQNNAAQLAASIGRQPTEGELYIAHFLGSDGAKRLINAAATQPDANAATMFPQAAAANPGIFLHRSGQARSVREVYSTLTGRFDVARAAAFAPGLRSTEPVVPRDIAGVAEAYARANNEAPARPLAVPVPVAAVPPQQRPLFQSMFSDRTGPVAPTVNRLWTPAKSDEPAPAQSSLMLNLFTDTPAPRKAGGGKT